MEEVKALGVFGNDGMLGRGILAGNGGRVIFGTEGNVGNDATLGNGGNVTAVGMFGIAGNCGTVG